VRALDGGEVDIEGLARAAASTAGDGVNCGLACVATAQEKVVEISIGVWRPGGASHSRLKFGGHSALVPDWATTMALNALRK
jgi:hypothetical protein